MGLFKVFIRISCLCIRRFGSARCLKGCIFRRFGLGGMFRRMFVPCCCCLDRNVQIFRCSNNLLLSISHCTHLAFHWSCYHTSLSHHSNIQTYRQHYYPSNLQTRRLMYLISTFLSHSFCSHWIFVHNTYHFCIKHAQLSKSLFLLSA